MPPTDDVATELLSRMDRLDRRLDAIQDLLLTQRTVKEKYTTAEAAQLLGKAEFTVREWCRLGRIRGEKRACGRGGSREWVITHAELTRYRNEGLRPRSEN